MMTKSLQGLFLSLSCSISPCSSAAYRPLKIASAPCFFNARYLLLSSSLLEFFLTLETLFLLSSYLVNIGFSYEIVQTLVSFPKIFPSPSEKNLYSYFYIPTGTLRTCFITTFASVCFYFQYQTGSSLWGNFGMIFIQNSF